MDPGKPETRDSQAQRSEALKAASDINALALASYFLHFQNPSTWSLSSVEKCLVNHKTKTFQAMDELVLIIENDEGMRLILRKKLADLGIRTAEVATGGEALDWLAGNHASLILLDLNLPDITGQELLSLLEKRGASIPFIVVSGMDDVRHTVEMMRLGALDFVLKDSALLDLVGPVVKRGIETLESRRISEEKETRFRYICETIESVFWMMNNLGDRVTFVSPAFESIWGFSAGYLYDHPDGWNEAIIEEDRPKVLRSFANLRKGIGHEFDETYRIRDKFGKIRWIHDRGYAHQGPYSENLNFTGVATEITRCKELERQLLEIAEKERLRIGEDLHDDLCQRMAAMGLKCGIIHDVLENGNHPQAKQLETIIRELQEATALTRLIAKDLSPVTMEAEGLMAGLKNFTETIAARFRVCCEFDCPEPVEVSNATTASNIFRIARELVNNASIHARPTRILLGLYNSVGGLRLEVHNDGIPFWGPEHRREGMGLHFVQFRADAIGAALDFFPGDPPDGGTRAVCIVPLGAEKGGTQT